MLSDRTASLKFLMKLGRKSLNSEEFILEHAKLAIPEIKLKKKNKVSEITVCFSSSWLNFVLQKSL